MRPISIDWSASTSEANAKIPASCPAPALANSSFTITTAPCCWGVDDVRNPHLPPWERVLDEAAAAGFGGLELGPYGYMPLDVGRVGAALDARGLRIVAGTIFDDLVSPANRENLLRQTDEICAFITALPRPQSHAGQRHAAPYLTVMDWGHDERDYARLVALCIKLLPDRGQLLAVTNHRKTSAAALRRLVLVEAERARRTIESVKVIASAHDCPEGPEGPHPSKSVWLSLAGRADG